MLTIFICHFPIFLYVKSLSVLITCLHQKKNTYLTGIMKNIAKFVATYQFIKNVLISMGNHEISD